MLFEEIRERLAVLIEKGEAVLQTHEPNPSNVIGFPYVGRSPICGVEKPGFGAAHADLRLWSHLYRGLCVAGWRWRIHI